MRLERALMERRQRSLIVANVLERHTATGATLQELTQWAHPRMRINLRRTLNSQVYKKDFAHFDGSRYPITRLEEQELEARQLVTQALSGVVFMTLDETESRSVCNVLRRFVRIGRYAKGKKGKGIEVQYLRPL